MLLGLINEIYTQDNSGSILIVDDNADARRYLSEILAKQLPTHQTAMASSGVQALSIMEQETPRLVILDLLMPEMDGFDVVRWMRSNQRTIQVPVFILSGKVLTLDDIKRLESYRKITFQTKNVLADDELGLSLHRVLFDTHPLPTQTSAIAKRAVAYIHQNYAHPIARAEIARDIGVSENYLTQIFHQELGISLWEYINRYRVTQAKELLSQTDHSVSYIASLVGFDDPAYFSRVFRRYVGQSPRTYRVS
jgi:YesN/AraC family two-component response regulator